MIKLGGLFAAVVLGGAMLAAPAHAVTFGTDNTCALVDITPNANQCWGSANQSGPGGINDSEGLLNNNVYLDDPTPDNTTLGLFNLSDWQFAQKFDTGTGGGSTTTSIDVGLGVTPTGGTATGNWTMNGAALSAFEQVLIILKAGPTFAAYLFDIPLAANGGSWDTNALQDKDLSHLSIYVRGVSQIPLPAGILLLLSGLGGLGFVARRRRMTAA